MVKLQTFCILNFNCSEVNDAVNLNFLYIPYSIAPGLITFAMNAIRPFMSASTRNQMKIFNTNRQEWMSYLENKIDISERSQR